MDDNKIDQCFGNSKNKQRKHSIVSFLLILGFLNNISIIYPTVVISVFMWYPYIIFIQSSSYKLLHLGDLCKDVHVGPLTIRFSERSPRSSPREQKKLSLIHMKGPSVTHWVIFYRGYARQPCCVAGTIDFFSYGKNFLSYAKHFHCSCHETWLSCKTSIDMRKAPFEKSIFIKQLNITSIHTSYELQHQCPV